MMNQIRTCLVTKQKAQKKDLLRFVVMDGSLIWDEKQIMPGRGGYMVNTPAAKALLPKMKKKIRHFLKCEDFKIPDIFG